jgi:hypothetical protein
MNDLPVGRTQNRTCQKKNRAAFFFSVSGDFVEWALLLCRGLDQQRAWSGDISLRK